MTNLINTDFVFHLSRGNPNNFPCGLGLDMQVFGMTLGGKLFTEETLENIRVVSVKLETRTYDVFDSLNTTDIVKNNTNYRAIFIANYSETKSYTLSSSAGVSISGVGISGGVIPDPSIGYAVSDVDIAAEDIYTFNEVNRDIPNQLGMVGNPSIYLDDEYDSSNKLSGLTFKKILTSGDLPSVTIPPQSVLKLWIRRTIVIDKAQDPGNDIVESFILLVNEENGNITPLEIGYRKLAGRIPINNWFDCTITSGTQSPFIFKELLSKDVDVSLMNIIKVYIKDDKVLIFYYTEPAPLLREYILLIVQPNSSPEKNKYIQITLETVDNVLSNENLLYKTNIDIFRSYYNDNIFYLFWNDSVYKSTSPDCPQYFGYTEQYTRISVDELDTTIWTDDIFDSINEKYEFRKIETYKLIHNKIIRNFETTINIEQFDDLFILFSQNTQNAGILDIENINLNSNELLYLFEKDIITSITSNKLRFPIEGAQVLSQRLYPSSLPAIEQLVSYNNARNSSLLSIISDSSSISRDVVSPRRIKYLLDGTRYVDLNSVHHREFKLGNELITHEITNTNTSLKNILFTTSIAVTNNTDIYSELKDTYVTTAYINNVYGGVTYDKPDFQNNIIDSTKTHSLSIPIEWEDRIYKDEWKTVLSTVPNAVSTNPLYKLQYNFSTNLWKSVFYNISGALVEEVHNNLSTAPPSGTGKLYDELNIVDLPYILEPDTYQPLSVNIDTTAPSAIGENYLANIKVYFKGNEVPLADVNTTTDNISYLGNVFINSDKDLNIRINYMDVMDGEDFSAHYYVKNLHKSLLNQITFNISTEYEVNPTLYPDQAKYRFFRKIKVNNLSNSTYDIDKTGDITIPITLYGNGYKTDSLSNTNLSVPYPFSFSEIDINDKNIRFCLEGSSTPLPLKISYYDYERDYAVAWIRLTGFLNTYQYIHMYYSKVQEIEKMENIQDYYLHLKNNLYPSTTMGAWHFDKIIPDIRLSFNSGKIFSVGEPVIYEKSFDNTLKLSKIEKEYMYGVAKVYKSNMFNINMDIPAEESLFLDEGVNAEFVKFIKSVAGVFKPSYSDVNEVQQNGIDILEAGDEVMGLTTNKRVSGLVAMTPNSNVMTYYDRTDDNKFKLITSVNGYSNKIDWVVSKPINSTLFKSGIIKINGTLKSETIKFDTPFKDDDYFVFFASATNQNLYWNILCSNKFTVSSSYLLDKELSWMAFHRDIFGGVYTPNSIFVGERTLTSSQETSGGEAPTTANLPYWYNNYLLIQPELGIQDDSGVMSVDPTDPGYSILLSSNENINLYWDTKYIDKLLIKTSSPAPCIVHWLVIKNGVEWWQELI